MDATARILEHVGADDAERLAALVQDMTAAVEAVSRVLADSSLVTGLHGRA
jgi:hypothetical protein